MGESLTMDEDTASETASKGPGACELSLVELSTMVWRNPNEVFGALAQCNCACKELEGPWTPLLGGLEYNQFVTDLILVDGVASSLSIEVKRAGGESRPRWVGVFELKPAVAQQHRWFDEIRSVLLRDFHLQPSDSGNVETFKQDTLVQVLLFDDKNPKGAHLLLTRVDRIRNPGSSV